MDTGITGLSDAASAILQKRFNSKTRRDPVTGCLEWIGGCHSDGYGIFRVGRRVLRAPRVVWELAHGPIPLGQVVRHKVCDNRRCVDPTHLAIGTQAENMADMVEAGRSARTLGDHEVAAIHGFAMDRMTQAEIGARFNVSQQQVSRILGAKAREGAVSRELDKALKDPEWVTQGNSLNSLPPASGDVPEAA